jgi:predicted MFS family arabinose efflux permease
MSGTKKADRFAPRDEWRRGWPTVAACMAGTSAGLQLFTYLSSLFVKPLAADFGWSRGQIASTSGAILICALMMPLTGFIADRRGIVGLAALGCTAFAACYFALGSMTGAFWQYLAVVAVIACVGGPCTNFFLFARPVVAAFDRSRGLALSVSLCGVPVASLVILPLIQHIIVAHGWRAAYLTLAPLSLALGAVAVFLLRRMSSRSPGPQAGRAAAAGVSFREAMGDRRFWLLLLAAGGVCLPTGFYVSSLQPMLSDKGVGPGVAALLGSWYAVAAILGRLAVGSLLDRLSPIWVGAFALGAPAVALLIFFFAGGDQVAALAVAVALFAVANGAEADVVCFQGARYFGLRANGRLNGVLGATSAVAIAIGAMASGYAFDRLGSYDAVLLAGVASSAVAAVALFASGWSGRRTTILD